VNKVRTIALLAMVVLVAGLAQAKQLAVVVDKENKTDDITTKELANILNGKTKTWTDGRPIKIVMRDPSSQDAELVFRRLLNTTPEQVRAFIQAHPSLIVVANSDAEVLHLVSVVRGAIGFVDLYSLTKDVKIIKIDKKLPFDLDYLLKGDD
jgi:ABC-type phosphate transport system substrate-binding protein